MKFFGQRGVYVVCDIGGTRMRVATSQNGETLSESRFVDTPASYEEGVSALSSLIAAEVKGAPIRVIVCGVPGTRHEDGRIYKLPNLPLWDGKDFAKDVREKTGAPVHLQNDSALVALGEAHLGAGKGASIFTYVTVSTGIGGARVVDGRIDRSVFGFEPGWQIIAADAKDWQEGTLGSHVSGRAIRDYTGRSPREALADASLANELARQLALGLFNMTLHWSPERIVLGGPLIVGENPIPLAVVERYLDEFCTAIYPHAPALVPAQLGDNGGLLGALWFAKSLEK